MVDHRHVTPNKARWEPRVVRMEGYALGVMNIRKPCDFPQGFVLNIQMCF